MSIFDEKHYRFVTNDDDDESVLLVEQRVDLSTVNIGQDEDGFLVVTEKPKPAPAVERVRHKYELTREGDLYRLRALVDIPAYGVRAGDRGGLVSDEYNLSQQGSCWIDASSTVTADADVRGNALVGNDSNISGRFHVADTAHILRCELTGVGSASGATQLYLCKVNTAHEQGGAVYLSGVTRLDRSEIQLEDGELHIQGCCVQAAYIRNQFELVSVAAAPWGWLDAFRDVNGEQRFSVGCQSLRSTQALQALADRYGIAGARRAMLNSFIELAQAARQGWVRDPEPAKSEPVQGGVEGSVAATVPQDVNQYGEDVAADAEARPINY